MEKEFCIVRLGKSSRDEITTIDSNRGALASKLIISVVCSQVPHEIKNGVYCFIWLGSDNNKGVPTKWQQGLRAFGTVVSKTGGPSYKDEWHIQISIGYILGISINKHSFVEYAPALYHSISDVPVIGLSNSSNQTVQLIKPNHPNQNVTSLFRSVETIHPSFIYNILKVYPSLDEINLDIINPLFQIQETEEENLPIDIINSAVIEEEIEEFQPFNPEKISIDTKGITMDTCLRRLEQNTIILAPDFQRNEVWTMEKKCRLIESLMLKIPLPMFYVSADEKGIFSVVDGLQRLSTIRSFVLGDLYLHTRNTEFKGYGFALTNLEFWGDKYNDLTFSQLPVYLQNRILETEFTFTIINPGTPEEVKRNVFKRINTGGEPLTAQEIRNALYSGQSTKLLKDLTSNTGFLRTIDNSVKSERMADRELILRFLAFTVRNYKDYPRNNDMDSFLSDTMRIINVLPNIYNKESSGIFKHINREQIIVQDVSELKNRFVIAMERAQAIFGIHSFRKSYSYKRKSPINKALFEVWSVLLSNLTDSQFLVLKNNKTHFLNEYIMYLEDNNFNYAISRNGLKYTSVKERYEKLSLLLNKIVNAD